MPIYEFYSPDTNRIYSFLARSLSLRDAVPSCPDDPKARMERMVSQFAVTGKAKEASAEPGPEMMDAGMEQVLARMEREMSTLNPDNPDPRQLGRMMRQMAEATGQKVPEGMREMIMRLERGEDPEKLEQEYGDNLEDFAEGEEGAMGLEKTLARIRRGVPSRDPQLYEMRDYLPEA